MILFAFIPVPLISEGFDRGEGKSLLFENQDYLDASFLPCRLILKRIVIVQSNQET